MTEFYTEYDKMNLPLDHIDVIPDGYYAAKVEANENWARCVRINIAIPICVEAYNVQKYINT